MKSLLTLFLMALFLAGCADTIRSGRNAFHGGNVLVDESQKAGEIIVELGTEFDPFEGNGRTCGSCHKAQDRFGMSAKTRRSLKLKDPFFYRGLEENQALLRNYGLVHVVGGGLNEFRQIPALNTLCKICDEDGQCTSLGLNGDGVSNLHVFTVGAIIAHSAKTPARVPGVDFVIPDAELIENIVKYMLSDNVCSVDH